MESAKGIFKLFNEFIFFDHSEGGVDVTVNVLRKYIVNRFHNTIPPSRILTSLSLIDDKISKLRVKNLEKIQDDTSSVRENVLYMVSFERFVEDNPAGDNDDDDHDDDKCE